MFAALFVFLHTMLRFPQGHILIAEDDEDDQYLLSSAFQKLAGDVELVFVQNGIELLEYFSVYEDGKIESLPVLLIMDLNMPQKNGKETLLELSKKPYFKELTTVVFSTTGNPSEMKYCAEIGVTDFYVKPASYSELLQIVERFLKLASSVK